MILGSKNLNKLILILDILLFIGIEEKTKKHNNSINKNIRFLINIMKHYEPHHFKGLSYYQVTQSLLKHFFMKT